MRLFFLALVLSAISLPAQVAQPALPAEIKDCHVLETLGNNRLLLHCAERALLVRLKNVDPVPPDPAKAGKPGKPEQDYTLSRALRGESYGFDREREIVLVVPSAVEDSGTVIAEVFIQKGSATGRNIGLAVLASGGGVLKDRNAAPSIYQAADDQGALERKRKSELEARLAKPKESGQ